MRPITFERSRTIRKSATEISSEIADVARWREFRGYGILPGIESAEYEERTDEMVGSRVRVRNTDGSEHIEEIREWDPGRRIVIELGSFMPPLSRVSTHFFEEWGFQSAASPTKLLASPAATPRGLLAKFCIT